MRGKKERILSCIMAVLLCLTPPVMFLTQAEKEDVSVRLEAAQGETGRPIFSETQEDQMVLPPGTEVAISGKDEKGETLPVKDIEMFAEEGERLDADANIKEGLCHIKMPKQDAVIFVRFEKPAKDKKAAAEDAERGDDAADQAAADAEDETHDRDLHLLMQGKRGRTWKVDNARYNYGHFYQKTGTEWKTSEQGKIMIEGRLGFCMNHELTFRGGDMREVDPVATGYETQEIMHELAVKTELIRHGKVPSCPGMTDRMRFAICQAMIWRRLAPRHGWALKEVKVDYTGKNAEHFGKPHEEKETLAWVEKMYKKHKNHYKTSWIFCVKDKDQPVCAFSAEKIPKGEGKVKKVSSDTSLTDKREAYSLEGAKFGFYQNGRLMGTVTTDKHGNSPALSLYPGTYTVREEEAPAGGGYAIEKKEKTVVIRSKTTQTVKFADRPRYGEIRVRKVSGDSDISVGDAYKLGGAEFSLYRDKACQKLYQKKETDEEGYAVFEKIPLGTWYVKETRAPKGFLLCETVRTVTIKGPEADGAEETKITKDVEISDHPASGKIEITKTPSVPESVEDNANYSLAGACYEVRRAESDAFQGKLVTDKDGQAMIDNLPLGDYTIREIEASPGYKIDPTIYDVSLRRDDSKVHVVTEKAFPEETPKMANAKLLLAKKDSETGEGVPAGRGTFAGAQFKICFYDTYPSQDGKPLRTWIYQTNEKGEISFADRSGYVSGDKLYCDSFGLPALPLGTLVVEEILPPEGYRICEEKFVIPVCETEGKVSYEAVSVPEDVITLELFKKHGDKGLSETEFLYRAPDGTEETVQTDENGRIVLKGLHTGDHVLEEVKAAEGYALLKEPLKFTVTEDRTFVFEKHPEATWAEEGRNCLSVTVRNRPLPYRLKVHKKNESEKVLKGAKFRLSDETGWSSTQTTDADGLLSFEGLKEDKTYTLEETKAPRGYRRLKDKDGNPCVFKVRVKNCPVEDVFEAEFDDQTADAVEPGENISVTGDKSDPEITVDLVNKAGRELPVTGEKSLAVFGLLGVSLIAAGRIRRRI